MTWTRCNHFREPSHGTALVVCVEQGTAQRCTGRAQGSCRIEIGIREVANELWPAIVSSGKREEQGHAGLRVEACPKRSRFETRKLTHGQQSKPATCFALCCCLRTCLCVQRCKKHESHQPAD
jgi:hypothetical protein